MPKHDKKMSVDQMQQSAIIRQVILQWLQKTVDVSQKMITSAFFHMKKFWEHDRRVRYLKRVDALIDVIEVMYCCSEKGNRSASEKRILHELLLGPNAPHSIFHKMSDTETDRLFDEVDMHFSDERMILFLQGDPGKCSYIVVTGRVDIYMEKTKEGEANLLKKYKKKRDYEISEEAVKELGTHIRGLTTGNIFGDLSVHSKKPRTYAAIAAPQSLILIVESDIYDQILRPYRLSEEQLTIATGLLRENILFSHYDDAKLLSLAYSLHYREVNANTTIVAAGSAVKGVLIILRGEVKAFPFDSTDHKGPRVAVAQLGRGTIIGERELLKQSTRFHMSYVTAGTTQIFEMDAKTFQDNSCSDRLRAAERFKNAERAELAREEVYLQRLNSSKKVLGDFMMSDEDEAAVIQQVLSGNGPFASLGHHSHPTINSIVRHANTNIRATHKMSQTHINSERSLTSVNIIKTKIENDATTMLTRADPKFLAEHKKRSKSEKIILTPIKLGPKIRRSIGFDNESSSFSNHFLKSNTNATAATRKVNHAAQVKALLQQQSVHNQMIITPHLAVDSYTYSTYNSNTSSSASTPTSSSTSTLLLNTNKGVSNDLSKSASQSHITQRMSIPLRIGTNTSSLISSSTSIQSPYTKAIMSSLGRTVAAVAVGNSPSQHQQQRYMPSQVFLAALPPRKSIPPVQYDDSDVDGVHGDDDFIW
eukprot:gene1870-3627_t